jgi:hypothetical protein
MRKTTMTLSFLLAVACASCAQVEAEIPEAQVTEKNLSFQGAEGWGSAVGDVSVTRSFTLSAANLSWIKDLNSKIYITRVELRARTGVDDLSFIRYAHLTMADAENDWQAVDVLDYQRPENQAATPMLSAKTLSPIDVSQIWKAKTVVVTISLAGVVPDKPWTADATLYLSGKISYKL